MLEGKNTPDHDNGKHIFLPEDLILEILVRLPVKSLIRFKSVCKEWKPIITDPNFAKSQLNHSKTSKCMSSSFVIIRSDNSMFMLNLDLNNLASRKTEDIKGKFVPISPRFNPSLERQGYNILCSFKGILCVYVCDTENIFMWNPNTNESRLIPSPGGTLRMIGFGYVSSTNDYKIVLVSWSTFIKVYSFRENKWHKKDYTSTCQYLYDINTKAMFNSTYLSTLVLIKKKFRSDQKISNQIRPDQIRKIQIRSEITKNKKQLQ
ncbi:hypothetical protein RDABS01_033247 [Bienertia sinuspersici]